MSAFFRGQYAQPAPPAGNEPPLASIGAIFAGLTLVTPFAFQAGGDNAFIALAIPASLLTLAATHVAERISTKRALWLIFGVGIMLRGYVLLFDPLLSATSFATCGTAEFKLPASTLTAIFLPTMRWRICATRRSFPRSIGPIMPSQSIRQSLNSFF